MVEDLEDLRIGRDPEMAWKREGREPDWGG